MNYTYKLVDADTGRHLLTQPGDYVEVGDTFPGFAEGDWIIVRITKDPGQSDITLHVRPIGRS